MEHTKARILHVDDHQDTRLMMAALLQDRGYGVLTAGNVGEALELAKEIAFDLYILDVRLPDGTGVELCQKLRELRPGFRFSIIQRTAMPRKSNAPSQSAVTRTSRSPSVSLTSRTWSPGY